MAEFVLSDNLVVLGSVDVNETKLINEASISWRNAADDGNIVGLSIDDDDILQIGEGGGPASVNITPQVTGQNAGAYALLSEAASATNPTLIPDRGDLTTGIGGFDGGPGGHILNLIVQGNNIAQLETGSVTFSVGQLQNDGTIFADGAADVVQLRAQGHSTQTSDIFLVETSTGTDLLTVNNSGNLTILGDFNMGAAAALIFAGSGPTIFRDGAPNLLAIQRGLNPNQVGIYNTFTSGTSLEAADIGWVTVSNTFLIQTRKGSAGGAARAISIRTDEVAALDIDTSQNVSIPTADLNFPGEAGNIGTSQTANRPDNIFCVSNVEGQLLVAANEDEGRTARITRRSVQEVHTLTLGATSVTTALTIPAGARLLGASFNVDTAVTDDAGDDTWSAAFSGGSTTALATGAAAAQDTKVDTMVVDEITSGVTEITFTPNGGNFTAGVIEVVVYYEELTSLANV